MINGSSATTEHLERHRAVLAMEPVGYWAADEGEGDTLHDRSGRGNHGRLVNLPWDKGLLDFTSGFHWVEIPGSPAYRSKAISLGGWFFTRRGDYGGGSELSMSNLPGEPPICIDHAQGCCLINSAHGDRGGWLRFDPGFGELRDGVGLRLRSPGARRRAGLSRVFGLNPIDEGGCLVDVVHARHGDAIGSAAGGIALVPVRWHHLLYCFAGGTGRLYVDGAVAKAQAGVEYVATDRAFVIGNDMSWWMLSPTGSQSLDGSVRDIVLFDRELSPGEVGRLVEATRPALEPSVRDHDALVVDGRWFPVESIGNLTVGARRRALEQLSIRRVERVRAMSAALLPVLAASLSDPETAPVAAGLLASIDGEEAREALRWALRERLLPGLEDNRAPPATRASAALAIAAMGAEARETVPAMLAVLRGILDREGSRIPRVEDFLRNALLRALLDVARDDDRVRDAVGEALALPLIELQDLGRSELAEVRSLSRQRRFLDALEILRDLPPGERGEPFFSQGDRHRDRRSANELAYMPVTERGGETFVVGSGRAWDAADEVSEPELARVVASLPVEHRRAAEEWCGWTGWRREPCRVSFTKTGADGRSHSAILGGEEFIFDGHDRKMRGWTIAVDELGYLHLVGGMHNRPEPSNYLPGSWERLGLSRDPKDAAFPALMYWVSREPGDIGSFEFVGRREDPRNLPEAGMDYMNFVQNKDGVLYLYGRVCAQSIQCWGLYRYDAAARRWTAIGGDPLDVVRSVAARGEASFVGLGGRSWQPNPDDRAKVFAWAWYPNFYNFGRGWGVRFDPTGRMHARLPLRGLGAGSRILDSQLYAYSDDGGKTFFGADGTPVRLPLTVNPAREHHADVGRHFIVDLAQSDGAHDRPDGDWLLHKDEACVDFTRDDAGTTCTGGAVEEWYTRHRGAESAAPPLAPLSDIGWHFSGPWLGLWLSLLREAGYDKSAV